MKKQILFSSVLAVILTASFSMRSLISFGAEPIAKSDHGKLLKLQGEIMEVEELREPEGSAIYTVKDLASGDTVKLFAHSHRSTIWLGNAVKSATDVLPGSKATIIYRKSIENKLPEVVFAKVSATYYS